MEFAEAMVNELKKLRQALIINTKPYLTREEAAEMLSISIGTLMKMPLVWIPMFPGSRSLVIRREDIEKHLKAQINNFITE